MLLELIKADPRNEGDVIDHGKCAYPIFIIDGYA